MNKKIIRLLLLSLTNFLTIYFTAKITFEKKNRIKEVLALNKKRKILELIKIYSPVIIFSEAITSFVLFIDPKKKRKKMSSSESILFYDLESGRYFTSDECSMNDAIKKLKNKYDDEGFCSLNDFYSFLGIERIDPKIDKSWKNPYFRKSGFPNPKYTFVKTDDGIECYILSFSQNEHGSL